MEVKTEKQLEDEWGPAKALSPTEIIKMFKWAKLKKTDVFYDLGSGHGRVVRGAIEHGKVKKAIGIEHEDDRFCKAREIAKRALSKNKLKKIDFWLGEMDEFDISNATKGASKENLEHILEREYWNKTFEVQIGNQTGTAIGIPGPWKSKTFKISNYFVYAPDY